MRGLMRTAIALVLLPSTASFHSSGSVQLCASLPRRNAFRPMHRLSMSTVKGTSADRSKERRLLRGVLVEALAAQKRKRTALESQLVRAVPETSAGVAHDEEGDDKAAKQRTKPCLSHFSFNRPGQGTKRVEQDPFNPKQAWP